MSVKAIHTAARRFCWDAIAHQYTLALPSDLEYLAPRLRDPLQFCDARRELYDQQLASNQEHESVPASAVGDEHPFVYERARMLAAVLDEVERSEPGDFQNVAEVRAYLDDAGRRARVIGGWTGRRGPDGEMIRDGFDPHWSEDQRAAAERARAEYLEYVATVSEEEAEAAGLMPYRHVLGDGQVRRIRRECRQRWDADPTRGYWFPLKQGTPPTDVLIVDAHSEWREFGPARLRQILLRRGITRVWEISEDWPQEPAREMDTRACCLGGIETMWSSRALDWLVYASHETSVTFAGAWLVRAVKAAWPTWEDALYERYLAQLRVAMARAPRLSAKEYAARLRGST